MKLIITQREEGDGRESKERGRDYLARTSS